MCKKTAYSTIKQRPLDAPEYFLELTLLLKLIGNVANLSFLISVTFLFPGLPDQYNQKEQPIV